MILLSGLYKTFLKNFHVQILDFFPGPGRLPEKPQAGSDRGFKQKTTDRDTARHLLPPDMLHQPAQDHLERHAMQWIL